MLNVLADENMPGLEAFEVHARVERMSGRAIRRQHLLDKQALLVRSVTRVDESLLAGTPVTFVGSATIGTDHIDQPWLEQQGITFAHAPGCNAMAVAEYVLQVVLDWSVERRRPPESLSVAVVGCGNVGARVVSLLSAAGLDVCVSDPPRQRAGEPIPAPVVPLVEALRADIVTLHVPLTEDGTDATRHLLAARELDSLRSGQLLINTARGPVIDNAALEERLQDGGPDVVLDVWEQEPRVPGALFQQVRIGTPHIAGYSVEGKLRGSAMIFQAFCRWQGLPGEEINVLPPEETLVRDIVTVVDLLSLLRHRYDPWLDHRRLEETLSDADPVTGFDALRRHYRRRHECAGVGISGVVAPRWQKLLRVLGVRFADSARTAPKPRTPAEPSPR